jgi:Pyruvate:ferredoxin oxidoreductase and related 2-oxoacid:ferredoxin oxidoreductases, gamma subunit
MKSVYQDVIMAGFGGQGVMLIGNLLAYAGMDANLNVTFIPVYGPEMRGGTANCTVVVSSEEIGSPIIQRPKGIIALNQPSLEKFQPKVEDGGVAVVNSSLIDMSLADTQRLRIAGVAANAIAHELGNTRMVNMVALGAYVKATGVMPLDAVIGALEHVFPPRNHKLIPKNAEALRAGFDRCEISA